MSRKTVASLQAGTTRSRKDHSIDKLSRKKAFAVEISVLTIIATEVQRHLSRRRCKECMKFYEFYVQTRLRCNEYESDEHSLSSNENKVWKNPGQYGI